MADARWSPMLCEPGDAIPTDPDAWVLEPKYDGWRTLVVIEPAGVTVIGGRNNKTYTGQVPYIESALAGALPVGTVVDGELIDPANGWNGVQSAMTNKRAHTSPLTFVAFDVLQVNGNDVRGLPWENRRAVLEMIEWPEHTYLTPTGVASEQTHVRMLDLGMEGSVVKRRDSVYVGKRSPSWRKLKAIASEDCVIVGFEDGKNGRAGQVGAIIVQLPSGVQTTASGMNDKERADMLANPDNWLGQTVEIAHNGVMESGKLRHPRYKRRRDDRSPAPAPKPASTSSRRGSPRMRNYKAMGDAKLRDCLNDFQSKSGEHYRRAEADQNFSVLEHQRACVAAALDRGMRVPAFL